MDDHVLRGIAKWPNVPAVYGWLSLDRRGNWLLRGERIDNPVFTAYIARNYEHDDAGRWFFQNGPQRVYAALDYAPWVLRVAGGGAALVLDSHTGERVAAVTGAWIDDAGAVLIETGRGIGLVDDRDLDLLLAHFIDANGNPLPEEALENVMALLETGHEAPLWLKFGESNVKIEPIRSVDVAQRFRFEPQPAESGAKA